MSQRRVLRKTKVIATIGPASDAPEIVREMVEAGMNVARLNFSHGTHAEHARRLEMIREASRDAGANVAVMLDTKGMEIRTGTVAGGEVELVEGQPFTLYTDERIGDTEGASVSHERLPHEVRLGSTILLDDGRVELRIVGIEDDAVRCRVVRGGELGGHKNVNVPDAASTLRAMGSENTDDLLWAVKNEIDYIAASWVRGPESVHEIREFLRAHGAGIPIIAKIENREGVANLDAIVAAADGTMVARGDLGVEMPVEQVPMIQKKIIRTTVMSGKPVITATQMLDSMERSTRPTRAEVSDVANAILDGTSAVMLSGETAKGRHPVEAVRTMAKLALQAEASLKEYGDLQHIAPHPANIMTESVAQAAITMANHLRAAAILALTESGFTARSISKYRPDCPILAVTSSPEAVRKLAMNWGVFGILYSGEGSDDAKVAHGVDRARELGYVQAGDVVVVTAGISREAGSTNMIRVLSVGDA
jgi:pyruvate kinase